MHRTSLIGMTLGVLLSGFSGILLADEADELWERARILQKKAAVLDKEGNQEQAQQLRLESEKLVQAAGQLHPTKRKLMEPGKRPRTDDEARHLKERLKVLLVEQQKLQDSPALDASLQEARLAEVQKHIVQIKQELEAIHADHDEQAVHHPEAEMLAGKLAAAVRRIHHFHVAAQNLKEAGAHDLAEQIMEKAEAMEQEVAAEKQRLHAEMQAARQREHNPDGLQELREEIARLRAEVHELRQKIEN